MCRICAAGGGVVAIKVKTPQGTWLPLYTGAPLLAEVDAYKRQFWEWSPVVCRLNFKSNEIKIEIDTSMATGTTVQSAFDWVKVFGASDQQHAAIPYTVGANTTLVYQARRHEAGMDSFTYAASDCPGNPLRTSIPATTVLTILPVNNKPYADPGPANTFKDKQFEVGVPTAFQLLGHDRDAMSMGTTGFTFTVTKLPEAANISKGGCPAIYVFYGIPCPPDADGPVVEGDSLTPSAELPFSSTLSFATLDLMGTSERCGSDAITWTVTDPAGVTSEPLTTRITVMCPRACDLESDMVYEEGRCDQSTLKREMRFDWQNFSLFDNSSNVTQCDLPRAPTLPSSVAVDCDAISLDSSWAVNVILAGTILATAKVGLLVYALVHRHAMIYKKAQASTNSRSNLVPSVAVGAHMFSYTTSIQVSFLSLTIIGGIMADFAPVFLLGSVVTWRCHLFATWLLVATTMLCVALLCIFRYRLFLFRRPVFS